MRPYKQLVGLQKLVPRRIIKLLPKGQTQVCQDPRVCTSIHIYTTSESFYTLLLNYSNIKELLGTESLSGNPFCRRHRRGL